MKKFILLALVASAATLLTACASTTVVKNPYLSNQKLSTDGSTPIAHLQTENWGIYFLWFPLLTGSTEAPGSIAVLEDTVNLKSTVPVLTNQAAKLGATKTLNMTSQVSEWSFLFCVRSVNITANAVK